MALKAKEISSVPVTESDIESQEISDTIITQPLKLFLVSFGLILSVFIGALDETIVATALGNITKDLQAQDEVTWIGGGYLLTITACSPLYGKFSDIFGRKPTMLFAILVFLVGSILSAIAPSIDCLIIFRALSGIGTGGLFTLSYIIISDIVPVEKRSLFMSFTGGSFLLASGVGPLLGGFLVDYLNWRWVFYINIPIILITLVIIMFLLPYKKPVKNDMKLMRIDYAGTFTFMAGIILLVLGLNWGGKDYPWLSAPVILSLVLGFILLILFIVIEKRWATEPVIPLEVFNQNVILCCINGISLGIIFFGYLYYWPLYFQKVHHYSGTEAGLELLPFIFGVNVTVTIAGFIINYYRCYRPLMISGLILVLTGNILIYRLPFLTSYESIIYPIIIGVGIGLNLHNNIVAGQLSVKKSQIAIVTGFLTFCQNIGGVIGLAILGAILSNQSSNASSDILTTSNLTKDEIINWNLVYRNTFLSLIPFGVICLCSMIKFRSVPISPSATS